MGIPIDRQLFFIIELRVVKWIVLWFITPALAAFVYKTISITMWIFLSHFIFCSLQVLDELIDFDKNIMIQKTDWMHTFYLKLISSLQGHDETFEVLPDPERSTELVEQ